MIQPCTSIHSCVLDGTGGSLLPSLRPPCVLRFPPQRPVPAGEDVKTVQELLRHANSRITLDIYTQAVNSTKRAAQSKVVQMIVPGVGTKKDQARTGTEA